MIRKTYSVEKFGEFGNVVPPACTGHLEIIKKYNYAGGYYNDNC